MVAKKGSVIKKFCPEVIAVCLNADETYPVERMRKRMAGVMMWSGRKGTEPAVHTHTSETS